METRIHLDQVARPLPPLSRASHAGDGALRAALAHLARDPAFELVSMQVQLLFGTRDIGESLPFYASEVLETGDAHAKGLDGYGFSKLMHEIREAAIAACEVLDPQFPPLHRLRESTSHALLEISKDGPSKSIAYKIEEAYGGKVPRLPPTMITIEFPKGTELEFDWVHNVIPVHTQRGVYQYKRSHWITTGKNGPVVSRVSSVPGASPKDCIALALVLSHN